MSAIPEEESFYYITYECKFDKEPNAHLLGRGEGANYTFDEPIHLIIKVEASDGRLEETHLSQLSAIFDMVPVTYDKAPSCPTLRTPLVPITFTLMEKVCVGHVEVPGFVGSIPKGDYVLTANIVDQGLIENHEETTGSVAQVTSDIIEMI